MHRVFRFYNSKIFFFTRIIKRVWNYGIMDILNMAIEENLIVEVTFIIRRYENYNNCNAKRARLYRRKRIRA